MELELEPRQEWRRAAVRLSSGGGAARMPSEVRAIIAPGRVVLVAFVRDAVIQSYCSCVDKKARGTLFSVMATAHVGPIVSEVVSTKLCFPNLSYSAPACHFSVSNSFLHSYVHGYPHMAGKILSAVRTLLSPSPSF